MSPAASPFSADLLIELSNNVAVLLARTEGMPDMAADVVRLQEQVLSLREGLEQHSKATEAELQRLRTGSVRTRERMSFMKGKWEAYVAIALVLVEHFWPKGAH
jgi:hypothetical protein